MKPLNCFAKIFALLGFAGLAVATIPPLQAWSAATAWQETYGGKLRLLSGGALDGQLKAGLEIVLDEGWKTYWKVPGDSGVPPIFDASASKNLSKVDIRWPVPSRFDVGPTQMLGYKDAIIFPLLLTPTDPAKPVKLVLNAQVGLCSDLCVPLSADLTLQIASGGERDLGSELLIDRDLAMAPNAATKAFGIRSVDHQKMAGKPDRLVITTQIPDGYGQKDLFVEGPEDWLLPLTQPLEDRAAGEQQFELVLDGLPKAASTKDVQLTFTLTNGEEGVEQSIELNR